MAGGSTEVLAQQSGLKDSEGLATALFIGFGGEEMDLPGMTSQEVFLAKRKDGTFALAVLGVFEVPTPPEQGRREQRGRGGLGR